jgi:GntP family gluconate:H+ symporter
MMDFLHHPFFILFVGVAIVIGLIISLKMNAFIALLVSAIAVSLLAPGPMAEKMARVAASFGTAAGKFGIVVGLAAIIGECMMLSGAAQRIVQSALRAFGEKRTTPALATSGFVLGIPVFFDTVFYLLVPLARSLYRSTKANYLKYILAIAAGGAVTHTLVPPTPGPLTMAVNLGIDIGQMIMGGLAVALPAVIAGSFFAGWADRRMPIEMRAARGEEELEHEVAEAHAEPKRLPGLLVSLLPIVLPVVLISSNTLLDHFSKLEARAHVATLGLAAEGAAGITKATAEYLNTATSPVMVWNRYAAVWGNPNSALLLAAAAAMLTFVFQCRPTKDVFAHTVEQALMSAGVIILITAAGGAFGDMLKAAEIGPAIERLFGGASAGGVGLLLLGFAIAVLLKIAQGSSTVAMMTASAMIAAMLIPTETPQGEISALLALKLGFSPVWLATAIGGGSLVGSWMNDSGFWIFAKMSGLTEAEALKSWTPLLCVLGCVSLAMSLLYALIF